MRRRGRSRRAVSRSRGSSPGLAVAAVVVAGLLVLAFVVMSGGSGRPEAAAPSAPARTPPKSEPPDPKEAQRGQARFWLDQHFYDEFGRQKRLSGRQIHTLFAQATTLGYPALLGPEWTTRQKRIYELLLRREPNDPDANRAFGRLPLADYPEFFKVFRRLTDAKALPDEFVRLRDRYETAVLYGPYWRTPAVDAKEFSRVAALLRRFEAFEERMAKNPTQNAIFEAVARVKLNPILGAYETVHIERPPFVLFYAHKDLAQRDDSKRERRRAASKREALKQRLDSYSRLLSDYLAFFRTRWMKPLGLPEFGPRQLFFIWMFDDRKRFDKFGASMGMVHPPGLKGYFNPQDRWVYLYEPARNRRDVEVALAHELTHQLHWHFSKDTGPFANHFARAKAVWFKEGWAEFAGSCRREGNRYRFAQNAPMRMQLFHLCRRTKLPVYPVRELVKAESYNHYLKGVFGADRTSLGGWLGNYLKRNGLTLAKEIRSRIGDVYLEMLYAESWLLIKFCYEFERGKYERKILEFTKAHMKGFLGYKGERGYAQADEVFEQIFCLTQPGAWKRFQQEFDEYVQAKMYEIPPRK